MTDIVVTGIGFITPIGDNLPAAHKFLCEGGIALADSGLNEIDNVQISGEISDFDAKKYLGDVKGLRPLNRAAKLLASATQLAISESGLDDSFRESNEIGLAVGTTYCSLGTISSFDARAQREGPKYASALDFANTVLNSAAGQTAIWHGLRGCNTTLSAGSASSLGAIAYAADLLRTGRENVMIAGGLEELSAESLIGYRGSDRHCPSGEKSYPIPLDDRRNGFVVGEGAVMFVLERGEDAIIRGAKPIAKLLGVGEAFCIEPTDTATFSSTVQTAMNQSIGSAGISKEQLAVISLSANGSIRLDSIESTGAANCLGELTEGISVECPKAATGETLGAGGAIQLALLIESLRTGCSPGVANLLNPSPESTRLNVSANATDLAEKSGLVSSISADGHCMAAVVTV